MGRPLSCVADAVLEFRSAFSIQRKEVAQSRE